MPDSDSSSSSTGAPYDARHLPVPVTIRVEADRPTEVVRVVAAGLCVGASVTVSLGVPLDPGVVEALGATGAIVIDQDAAAWTATLAGPDAPTRVRLIGGLRAQLATRTEGRPDIAIYAQPVVEAGRIELLTFLHEQAIAVTAHRFGSPTPLVDNLF